MNKQQKKELVNEITETVEKSVAKARTVNSFSTRSTRTVLDIVDRVVYLIEQHSEHVSKLKGNEKKKLAVQILNNIINIKIKFIPRKIMDKIEGILISLLIDFTVGWLNKKLGKAWLQA